MTHLNFAPIRRHLCVEVRSGLGGGRVEGPILHRSHHMRRMVDQTTCECSHHLDDCMISWWTIKHLIHYIQAGFQVHIIYRFPVICIYTLDVDMNCTYKSETRNYDKSDLT